MAITADILMMKKKIIPVLIMVIVLAMVAGCKKKKDDTTPEDSFDKAALLTNIADNIILPGYASLKLRVDSVKYYNDLFVANPNSNNLLPLQIAFQKAYLAYQRISVFEFGPADTELLRANFNTFPCDTAEIKTKIASNNMSISTVADLDAKGFPAIDFLLFAGGDNCVIARFTTQPDAAQAISYLSLLVNELKQKTDNVNTAWASYSSSFKSNTSSSVGSPIGDLVNQLNFDLEILKNAKLGIPAGKKSLGTPYPDKTEAYFSSYSLALAKEHLQVIENVFLGKSNAGDGSGFDDYLVHLQTTHPSGLLRDVIVAKFASAKAKLNAIPETLSQSVISNATAVSNAYDELQQLTVLLKVDMTSAIGVVITYQDNDGD